ncbi:MAG: hypothetical protein WCK04_05000 [Actinomycetes bacterium]
MKTKLFALSIISVAVIALAQTESVTTKEARSVELFLGTDPTVIVHVDMVTRIGGVIVSRTPFKEVAMQPDGLLNITPAATAMRAQILEFVADCVK